MAREHRFHLFGGVALFVVLEALLIVAVVYWPDFEESIDVIKSFMPGEIRGVVEKMAEGGVAGYVNGQHFFKGCNAVGTLAAVLFAMNAVAGEAQRGTLEMLLARPVSRRRILTERWVSGALAIVVPVFLSTWTIPRVLEHVDETMSYATLTRCAVQQSAFLLALYGTVFLASCAMSRPVLLALVAYLVALFQFAIYVVPGITHASLYRLVDVGVFARIGASQAMDLRTLVPLVLAVVATFVAAHVVYARRTP